MAKVNAKLLLVIGGIVLIIMLGRDFGEQALVNLQSEPECNSDIEEVAGYGFSICSSCFQVDQEFVDCSLLYNPVDYSHLIGDWIYYYNNFHGDLCKDSRMVWEQNTIKNCIYDSGNGVCEMESGIHCWACEQIEEAYYDCPLTYYIDCRYITQLNYPDEYARWGGPGSFCDATCPISDGQECRTCETLAVVTEAWYDEECDMNTWLACMDVISNYPQEVADYEDNGVCDDSAQDCSSLRSTAGQEMTDWIADPTSTNLNIAQSAIVAWISQC